MYSNAQLALKFIKYYLTASNGKGHGIHSPFVYEFVTKILNKKNITDEKVQLTQGGKNYRSYHKGIEVSLGYSMNF